MSFIGTEAIVRAGTSRGAAVMLAAVLLAPRCSVTSPPDVVDVDLTVSDTVLSATDTADVVVTATNRERHAVRISPSGCPQLFQVLDGDGDVVGPEPIACILVNYAPVTLGPGEAYDWSYRWHGLGSNGQRLPAGVYWLRGRVAVLDDGERLGQPVRVRLTAP